MQVPAQFEYSRAASVEHALELLERSGPEAMVLAGGHSLLPMMKLRLAQPETLIDINELAELSYIQMADAELRIGALTRHAELLNFAAAGGQFMILYDAERVIADPVVRNRGTVGGSVCQADPSEDLSAAFAAVRAVMVIRGRGRTRTVPAREFHTGPYETVVEPGELLTEIRIPLWPGDGDRAAGGGGDRGAGSARPRGGAFVSGSAYEKVERRVGDYPVAAAGAVLWLAGDTIIDAGVGLTAVGAEHFAAPEAEEFLRGAPATEESFRHAGQIAADHSNPSSDQRGPADYKRHLAGELTTRALRRAAGRARQTSQRASGASGASGGA